MFLKWGLAASRYALRANLNEFAYANIATPIKHHHKKEPESLASGSKGQF